MRGSILIRGRFLMRGSRILVPPFIFHGLFGTNILKIGVKNLQNVNVGKKCDPYIQLR